jgi:hypothetical protein
VTPPLPLPYQQALWDTAPLGNLEKNLQLGDSQEVVEVEVETVEAVEAEVKMAEMAEEVSLLEDK